MFTGTCNYNLGILHEFRVFRDAMVVTTLDTFTSFLSGLIIFGILGNLAYKMNVDVSEVVKSGGTGLAFISYPEAIAHFEMVPWVSRTNRTLLKSPKIVFSYLRFYFSSCCLYWELEV